MRYFKLFADAAFSNGPNGERLFYLYGPWSRPYIIPDAETQHSLYNKILWYYRISVPLFIAIVVLFQQIAPKIFSSSYYFEIFTILLIIAAIAALKILFTSQVRHLRRFPSRSLGTFFDNIAEKSSYLTLGLRMAVCVFAVGAGVVLIIIGHRGWVEISTVAFFALVLVAIAYELYRKLTKST
ncbi:MAG TPA: hypothetical protein VGQ90_17345 [Stellaceae bacterium]|jgi:hypothetical protein|nr:hypothetical protein [Stellaceae bacterium]